MLEGPSRALTVPIACKGSILALWHSMPTKAKILAHSLEVSKKKVTSVSDIPPLKLPTCGLYKIKKTSSFSLHPGGLSVLQAPSLLGWTPAQPMTSSASDVDEDFIGGGPGVGGPLHRKVLSLPYCLQWFLPRSCRFGQLAARVLMSSGLRMALLLSH